MNFHSYLIGPCPSDSSSSLTLLTLLQCLICKKALPFRGWKRLERTLISWSSYKGEKSHSPNCWFCGDIIDVRVCVSKVPGWTSFLCLIIKAIMITIAKLKNIHHYDIPLTRYLRLEQLILFCRISRIYYENRVGFAMFLCYNMMNLIKFPTFYHVHKKKYCILSKRIFCFMKNILINSLEVPIMPDF